MGRVYCLRERGGRGDTGADGAARAVGAARRASMRTTLWEASRDPRVWRWLPIVQPRVARPSWQAWLDDALERRDDGPRRAVRDGLAGDGRGDWLDALPRPASGAPKPRDRLDVAGTVRVGHGREHRGEAASAGARLRGARLPPRRVQDRRLERACAPRARGARGAVRGVHEKHMLVRDGVSRDSAWYAILDDDWPEVRDRLQARLVG